MKTFREWLYFESAGKNLLIHPDCVSELGNEACSEYSDKIKNYTSRFDYVISHLFWPKKVIEDRGVFGGGNELSDQGRKDILRRNTDEFSNKIIDNFFNLGVVKNIFEKNPNRIISIRNMVKTGVLVQDLINKLRGENLAPNARIQ